MCEISAYGRRDGSEELLLESVIRVEPAGEDGWRLISLFGEQRELVGKFKGADFRQNRIFFEIAGG